MANKDYAALSLQPSGSITKMRAEQIKSEDGLGSLAIDLEALRGQVKDIIGAADYKEEIAGEYAKVQIVDLADHLDASGAASLSVKKDLAVVGSGTFGYDVVVTGEARAGTVKALNLSTTDGALVFHGSDKKLVDNVGLKYDGIDSALVAPKFKGTNLTATRVTFVDANKNLIDDGRMTFAAGTLTVSGSLFSKDVVIAGDLTVNGTTTTVNSTTLTVDDKNIVIAEGGTGASLDGAGIFLGSEAGESLSWNHADTKWVASDKFMADTLQAGDLTSALVWADASGNLIEVANQDLADAIEGRLAAGTGVTISEAGAVITVAIGQPVATTDSVTFALVTGSNLTANRLMRSDGGKAMVSAGLIDFVSGTHLSVTADAAGGAVWALPQAIYTASAPEFSALNIGAAHDLLADGANLKLMTTGELVLSGADGQYAVAEAGDRAAFIAAFSSTETIVGALNTLAAGSGGGKGKEVKNVASDVASSGGAYPFQVSLAAGRFDGLADSAAAAGRLDVYVNGMLMVQDSDYSVVVASDRLDFAFPVKAGDVIAAVIR